LLDRTARLWDIRSGAQIAVLPGDGLSLNQAIFLPKGQRIVTVSIDNVVQLWRVPSRCQALIDEANRVLPRHLTPEERAGEFIDSPSTPLIRFYLGIRPFFAFALPEAGDRCE